MALDGATLMEILSQLFHSSLILPWPGQNQLPLDLEASNHNITPRALSPTPGSTTPVPPSRAALEAAKSKRRANLTDVFDCTLELEAESYRLESLEE
jgi:hypothetical protein